jgi:hypothetical protein
MSQPVQKIFLIGSILGEPIVGAALSAAATAIVPGDLIEFTSAGTVQEHGTAAVNAAKMFADENIAVGGTIDDAYGAGEDVLFGTAHSGQKVNARVAAGAPDIVKNDPLESAGDGTLRKAVADAATDTAQRDALVGYADEAVANSGGGTIVRIRIRVA